MTGSSERPAWKQELPDRLVQAQVSAVRSGLAAMELSLMAGPGRHWANLWKPLAVITSANHHVTVRLVLASYRAWAKPRALS
jgi:hypothetical protein